MARYKPREIVRRDAVPSRRAERPMLAVHADQEPTRYAGALAQVTSQGIGMLADIYAQRTVQKRAGQAEEDFNTGADMRRKEDLSGQQDPFRSHILEVASEQYKRGYYKTDAMLKIRAWSADTALQLAQAEPDADYGQLVQASKSELMQHPAFRDPQTRQEMMAMLDKVDDHLYTQHLERSAKEMMTRQEERLTAILRAEMAAGAPVAGVAARLRELTDTPEFGYLHQREADAIVINAVAGALASGEVDIAATLAEIEAFKDEHGVSWLDGAHGDAIRKAAATGSAQQEAQRDEARKTMQVTLERPLRELARQGRLTDDKILEVAEQLGMTGQEQLTFVRHWMNKQEQGLKAIQDAAEARRKVAATDETARRNPLWLSNADARKLLDQRLQEASGEDPATVIDAIRGEAPHAGDVLDVLETAAQWNIVPTFVTNILQRGGYTDADTFAGQSALYQHLRDRSPAFASTAAGQKAAVFEEYQATVVEGGHDAQAFLARQGSAKRNADEAAYVVNGALKAAQKEYTTITVDGDDVPRPAGDWFHIQRRAREIALDNPGVSGDTAVKTAVEDFDNDFLTIHGRRVPAQGLTQEHQQAIETYVGAIANRMSQRPDSLSAFPLHGSKAQWVVTGEDGFPISDPDTGARVVFSPTTVAGFWQDWKNETEDMRLRSRIRLRELNERMEQVRKHAVADDADVQALIDAEAAEGGNLYRYYPQIARDKVRGDMVKSAVRQIRESPEYQQAVQDKYSRTEISGIPLDFLEYLAKRRSTPERQEE